jgi:hypothetical protein
MEIAVAITAVANAIKITKALKSIENSYDQAELKARIAEIYEGLSDAKLALIDAREDIAGLKKENSRLKKIKIERERLVQGQGGYRYFSGLNGYPNGYPVCPKCEQIDARLILLVRNFHIDAAKCPACSNEYRPVSEYIASSDGNQPTTQIQVYEKAKEVSSRKITEQLRNLNNSY